MAIEQETQAEHTSPALHDEQTLRVQVHYPAAAEPFRDPAADRNETLGHLKARVLVAFGLTEYTTPDGTAITYVLFHGKQRLDDLSVTLGRVPGNQHELQLKLAQQLTQGDLGAL